jgi:hypothetical protein
MRSTWIYRETRALLHSSYSSVFRVGFRVFRVGFWVFRVGFRVFRVGFRVFRMGFRGFRVGSGWVPGGFRVFRVGFRLLQTPLEYCRFVIHVTSVITISYAESNGGIFILIAPLGNTVQGQTYCEWFVNNTYCERFVKYNFAWFSKAINR